MKTLIRYCACPLFFGMIIFTSCIKSDHPFIPRANYAPSGNFIDTLSGKEFQFDSLIWVYNADNINNADNVFISIKNRPDLFMYPRNFEVSLRPDISSAWVPVVRNEVNLFPPFGFVYSVGSGGIGIVPKPATISLEDRIASVKVRF